MAQPDPNALLTASKMMNDLQMRVFNMYVALGPTRSLSKVFDLCMDRSVKVTQRQLARWSAQWHWSDLATLTQREIARDIASEAMPSLKELTREDLKSIATLKGYFHRRVEIDPFDDNLDPKMRELAILPDLADYEKLLRMERLLLADPNDAQDLNKANSRVVQQFENDEELVVTLKRRTRALHNLPDESILELSGSLEDNVINVTPSDATK